jgi:hypothetical protein
LKLNFEDLLSRKQFMSDSASTNLRFLLWHHKVAKADWAGAVAQWTGSNEARAERLLSGSVPPSVEDLRSLAEALQISEDEILYADLLKEAEVNIWQENVLHLLNTLKHGENKRLASFLDLEGGTISKWKKRLYNPEKKHKQKLQDFFAVPTPIDLEADPVFLSLSPCDATSQRTWLHSKIDHLSERSLQQLFPALERLLREP